jgi:phospholipid/cholesterol/gamma-HCH transport system substrate-binding protein
MSDKKGGRTLIFVLFGVAVLVLGGLAFRSSDSGGNTEVSAMFKDAYPIVGGSTVKIGGVQVGSVDHIDLQGGMARVVMNLNQEALPVHTDARATIVTQDLLGEKFIQLDRGTANAPVLQSGGTLNETQTNRVVDLQDVLNFADTPTSTALSAMITGTGEGLRGNGKNASDALAALAPTMHQTDMLVKVLNAQNNQLNQLVDNAQPVASALASNNGQDLDSLVSSTTKTLSTVASQQQALRDTLTELPTAIASARRTLGQLAGVTEPTTDVLSSIRPATDNLSDISSELKRFSDAADPALGSLPPVLDKAKDLLDQARPVVSDLRPAGPDIKSVTGSFRNLNKTALTHLTDALELAKGWTLATTDYDSNAHYFKAILGFSPNDLGPFGLGPVPGAPRSYPAPQLPAPPEPQYGKDTQPLEPEGPGDPRTSRPTGSSGDSATGLSSEQEHSMVGQMLGGRTMGGGS